MRGDPNEGDLLETVVQLPTFFVSEDADPLPDAYDIYADQRHPAIKAGVTLRFVRKLSHGRSRRAVYCIVGVSGTYQSFWGEFKAAVRPVISPGRPGATEEPG